MKYFENCTTIDEAKLRYKKLAFELHPDISGRDSTAEFQEMQNQFEHFKPTKKKYEKEEDNFREQSEDFMRMINDLMNIKSIEFEVCGSFIWIHTETKEVRHQIKAIKNDSFKPACWHSTKMMWFFAPIDYKRGKTGLSIDEIRRKYGSEFYEGNKDKELKTA